MSKIRIKNFGPIREGHQSEGGWLDIKKVTTFIGNQGSGKSVAAKLISTFLWIEKALTRGDSNIKVLTQPNGKLNPWKYHRLENYFHKEGKENKSEIEYVGDSYEILFIKGEWYVRGADNGNYRLPQIMYVPAERNLLSYLTNINLFRGTISEPLSDFLTELNRAKSELIEPLHLPINDVKIIYSKQGDKLSVTGSDYSLNISESSSGFQSLVPLFLVSRFLSYRISDSHNNNSLDTKMRIEQRELFRREVSNILENRALTEEQKRIYITELSKRFNNSAFINIIEEPEQNLFPTSQWELLKKLLEFNNMNRGNKLVMTTHSPYLINYLTLAVKAETVYEKLKEKDLRLKDEEVSHVNKIVPMTSTVKSDNLVIYEMDEKEGIIKKLPDYKGLPSDENYLNADLEHSNELFAQLQEIERGWR